MLFNCKEESDDKEVGVTENIMTHAAWARLISQVEWYDKKSVSSQKYYKVLKIIQMILAVGIPVIAHLDVVSTKWIVSCAGALIAILESIQHMNQYSTLWVTYRSTAERLKHEKFLFLAVAGPYRDLGEVARLILLAERVEEHVSTEHANWINETRKAVVSSKGKENHE